jgi:hypothetical protein
VPCNEFYIELMQARFEYMWWQQHFTWLLICY